MRTSRKRKWRKFLARFLLAAGAAFFIAVLPLPVWTPEIFLYWQVPAAVFLFIVYIGKLLIDTILFPPKS
jgi:NADH:ubiquinone oxidoreductase subunit 2 (subunit N)